MSEKSAVILLNFGGPRSLEEVPSFLYEILRDPQVIQFPFPYWLQNRLARKISQKRAHKVQAQYQQIGGKSPIVEASEQQRQALRQMLLQQNLNMPVYVVHRYLDGYTESVVKQILEQKPDKLYMIPMYPHFSWTTSGSSLLQIISLLKNQGFRGSIQCLRSHPDHPKYIEALKHNILETITKHGLKPNDSLIFCSAHGVPQSYVKKGDPYLIELNLTMEALRTALPGWNLELCFQSRVGPATWLQPYTEERIPELGQEGTYKNIVFVGISFVNDHLETLFEIGQTYFELSRQSGLTPFLVPAIESSQEYIELLGHKVMAWFHHGTGFDPDLILPPDQYFQRYGRWALYFWILGMMGTLSIAI
ncbi:MAG: ferrochelatase [SAR324 cluster bacterium]|nr:ferrochelatase [SAR324 cluster bacterium]